MILLLGGAYMKYVCACANSRTCDPFQEQIMYIALLHNEENNQPET